MAYTKQTFATGDVFTAANANHIEEGIESVDRALATKVDAVTGKGLSTNDYTDAEKEKLAGVNAMIGATADAAGSAGLIPAPAAGDHMKYLRGDGTWDDLRALILAAYPATPSPNPEGHYASLGTAAQAVGTSAVVGIPPKQVRIKITAENGASSAVLTMQGTLDTLMGGGTTYTLDLAQLNGGQALPQNSIVDIYDGVRMVYYDATVYLSEMIIQKDGYISLTCDVGEVGMFYRQDPTTVNTALENQVIDQRGSIEKLQKRVAALEGEGGGA